MGRHDSLSTRRVDIGTLYFVALLREELGRRIKTARTSARLSQQELAWKIGLKHAQDVSRYERGKVEVPAHRIDLIAEVTGRARSFFVRDPAEPEQDANLGDTVRDAIRAVLVEEQFPRLGELADALGRLEESVGRLEGQLADQAGRRERGSAE